MLRPMVGRPLLESLKSEIDDQNMDPDQFHADQERKRFKTFRATEFSRYKKIEPTSGTVKGYS